MTRDLTYTRGEMKNKAGGRKRLLGRGKPMPGMSATEALFENTTNWSLYNSQITTAESFRGTQCIESTSTSSSPEVVYSLSSNVDLTKMAPSMAMKHTGSGAVTLAIKAEDANANWTQWRRTLDPSKHPTQWNVFDVGPNSASSSFDFTSVQSFKFSADAPSSGTVYFDELLWTENPSNGAVVFVFDDGNSTVYNNARPEFEKRGMVANVGVISSIIGDSSSMTNSQLSDLHDMGWGILNHQATNTSIYGVSRQAALDEVVPCKETLIHGDNKWYNGADAHIYMGGGHDENAMQVVSEYERAGFTTGSPSTGMSPFYPRNPYSIPRPFLSGNTVTTIEGLIDRAVARGALATLSFHTVGSSGDITQSDLATVLDYCDTQGARVMSMQEYMNEAGL